MGCFSFLCKKSGKAALSTSSNGPPCYLFLLKDGKVIEEMYGNYDSYGRVFKKGLEESYDWSIDWGDVCNLIFSNDESNGIAMILEDEYDGVKPTTRSDDDPDQGWGDEGDLMGDVSTNGFKQVGNPYHIIY